jgi:hypothetical protein
MSDYKQEYEQWKEDGAIVTKRSVPEEVKWFLILDYAKRFNLDTLIETGTAVADTLIHVGHQFENIYSFELMETYWTVAKQNLQEAKIDAHVFNESSAGQSFINLVKTIDQPALFYLDAHYSGEGTGSDPSLSTPHVPVRQELKVITTHSPYNNRNVIIVDDARCFKGQEFHSDEYSGYPSMEELQEIVKGTHIVTRQADAFVLTPKDVS